MEDEKPYTAQEFAELCRVDVDTVYAWCGAEPPIIDHYRIGRIVRIPREALEQIRKRATG